MSQRMITRMPPLRALAAFEAVARNLSFQKAAAELNVTPSAVSQQIKGLEEHLAISLIRRFNRRIALTEAGEIYYASVSSSFGAMADATERIVHHLNPKILMIRSAPSFAVKWLMPRLADFMHRHPDIDVRLDASNEKTDFGHEAVDLELRAGKGDWKSLYVEPLFRDHVVPLATPAFVQKHRLSRPEDLLRGVPVIHSVKCPVSWDMWLAANGLPAVMPRGPRFDRAFMAIQAALDGLGILLDSDILAAAELRDGRLITPFRGAREFTQVPFWFVCPFENRDREPVARFRDWLYGFPEMRSAAAAPDAAPDLKDFEASPAISALGHLIRHRLYPRPPKPR